LLARTGTDRLFRIDFLRQTTFLQFPLGQSQVFCFARLKCFRVISGDESDFTSLRRMDDFDEIPFALMFVHRQNIFLFDRDFIFRGRGVRVKRSGMRNGLGLGRWMYRSFEPIRA
jgi:hypothetical protein